MNAFPESRSRTARELALTQANNALKELLLVFINHKDWRDTICEAMDWVDGGGGYAVTVALGVLRRSLAHHEMSNRAMIQTQVRDAIAALEAVL